MTLALDIDAIKHSLGRWEDDLHASGLHARRLTCAIAREQLSAGYDVAIGQYVARSQFVEELARLAEELDARFREFVLEPDAPALAERLAQRKRAASRPEHIANTTLVDPEDAELLVPSLDAVPHQRLGHAQQLLAQQPPPAHVQVLSLTRGNQHRPAHRE